MFKNVIERKYVLSALVFLIICSLFVYGIIQTPRWNHFDRGCTIKDYKVECNYVESMCILNVVVEVAETCGGVLFNPNQTFTGNHPYHRITLIANTTRYPINSVRDCWFTTDCEKASFDTPIDINAIQDGVVLFTVMATLNCFGCIMVSAVQLKKIIFN